VAGAEERISLASGDKVRCDANRGVRFSTSHGGRIRHLDHIDSLDDADLQLTPIGMTLERRHECGGDSNEQDLKVEMTGGGKGAVHDGGRRVVATHRVNGDADHRYVSW
jgi:hypothetical protein